MSLLSSLHIPTLIIAGFCVVLMCGVLTLINWRQHPSERILLYTGLMLLLSCPAIIGAAMRDSAPYWIAAVFSNAILLFNAGLAWQAIRVFFGRREKWLITSLGAFCWVALSLVPGFLDNATLRIQVFSGVTIVYLIAAVYELLHARRKACLSTAPMLSILIMHGALHTARLMVETPIAGLRELARVPLVELLILEGVLYVIGTVTVSLMMVKDRAQQQLSEAAYIDVLTGIDNRRSFNKKTHALLRRASETHQPVSILLCDLDHFKKINDVYGHAAGDAALTRFAAVLHQVMEESHIYARIGGEEFACVLACDVSTALMYAEKIRLHYRSGSVLEHPQTVSIGVVSTEEVGYALPALMSASDEAMYQAKRSGRDQVRLYEPRDLAVS